jgi:hypothetical protein
MHVGPTGVAASVWTLANLPGMLTAPGTAKLGSTWTLSYDTTGPLALLGFDDAMTVPALYPGLGYAFLDVGAASLIGPLAVGAGQSLSFGIPIMADLAGIQGTLQIFDSTDGFSRPATAVTLIAEALLSGGPGWGSASDSRWERVRS